MNWDRKFLDQAALVASWSKDASTKVGAVIVGPDNEVRSQGYNGFPRGVQDDVKERNERPAKYLFTEHAERNAIYNAVRANIPIKGCRLYLNYSPCPCADCARAIIQSGIVEVIGNDVPFPGKGEQWEASIAASKAMCDEAHVKWRIVK